MSKHLKRNLDRRSEEHKEDVAREKKQYGSVRPPEFQTSNKTWKSYSRIKYVSKAFRSGYDQIDWGV